MDMELLTFTSDPDNIPAIVEEFEQKTGLSARSLALEFDTLGCDCAFGFIQRYSGAEPLSLLRFGHMDLPNVLKGLETDFAGLSDPAHLVAILRDDGVWDMHQQLYDMNWHTFLHSSDIGEQELLRKQARNLEFLRRKLLSDIAAGEKTFVVWATDTPLTENEAMSLFRAMRKRGNSRLLWVVQGSPPGLVEEVRPGLMRGNIDRWFWLAGPGNGKYSVGAWLNMLANARELAARSDRCSDVPRTTGVRTVVATELNFGRNGNATPCLRHGWSDGEDGFTWTLGKESALRLPAPVAPFGYFVEIEVNPLVEPDGPPAQRLIVAVGERTIGEVVLRLGARVAFFAPPPDGPEVLLSLRHPDVRVPEDWNRDVALAFIAIRLLALSAPAPAPTGRMSARVLGVPDDADDATLAQAAERLTAVPTRDLLIGFEMLAGNCEFGGVQRRFGAEPLSLLRFAGATPDAAVRGLDNGFEGGGEDIEPWVSPDADREWMIHDRRYQFGYHTFVSSESVSAEALVRAERRKVAFLRRKFLEDLAEGHKVYVCADRFGQPREAALPPFLALNRHGPRAMLWITTAKDRPVGTVEEMFPGLMVGYIDGFMADGVPRALDGWLTVLCNAYLLRSSPPSAKSRLPAATRRLVFVGNCQIGALMHLYEQYAAGARREHLLAIDAFAPLSDDNRRAIAAADLIVDQIFDTEPPLDLAVLAPGRTRISVPTVSGGFLWPFGGQAHPSNMADFGDNGVFPAELGDAYLNRLIKRGTDPDAAVAQYAELDVNGVVNLDRLLEMYLERQRLRDAATGFRLADLIAEHFRTEHLFLTPFHPNTRVTLALAEQLFRRLWVAEGEIAGMRRRLVRSPFPLDELPIHPRVREHFGLRFVAADYRYRHSPYGRFTFHEYARRYMTFDCNIPLRKGLWHAWRGEDAEALPLIEEGLVQMPDSAVGWQGLSNTLARQGRTGPALAAVARAIAAAPEEAEHRVAQAKLLAEEQHWADAVAAARIAAGLEPTSGAHHLMLSDLLFRQGDLDGAIEAMLAAIRIAGPSSALQMRLSELLAQRGRDPEAIVAVEQAIALHPEDSARAYNHLSHLLARQGRLADAIAAIGRSIEAAPAVAGHRIVAATLLAEAERWAEAAASARSAAELEPTSGAHQVLLADLLRRQGDLDGAITAISAAIRISPPHYQLELRLAELLSQRERDPEAIAAAERAIALDPEGGAAAYNHLSHLLERQGRVEDAIRAGQRAIEIGPPQPVFHWHMARLLAGVGADGDAATQMQTAAALESLVPVGS